MAKQKIICIACPLGCKMDVYVEGAEIVKMKGNRCKKGVEYGREEIFSPGRILTTTIRTEDSGSPLLPVRSDKPISKGNLGRAMELISRYVVNGPIQIGEIVIKNILNTGANIIASRSMPIQ